MKDVSIDDARFGVEAIGADCSEGLVATYVYPAGRKTEIRVLERGGGRPAHYGIAVLVGPRRTAARALRMRR